eukprot:Gb_18494 [translate_table: standard]
MTLHEWFQSLEEYFKYAGCQHEREKVVIVMIHLTGQAYTWATQICKYQGTDLPWNTLEEFKEGMELREKWQAIWEKCCKEGDPPDEEIDKESEEDNDKDFDSDNYEDCHEEEDCIPKKQLDKGYEEYDEDPDEDSDEEYDL